MAAKSSNAYKYTGARRRSDTSSDCAALANGISSSALGTYLGEDRLEYIPMSAFNDIVSNGSAVKSRYFRPWRDLEILGVQPELGAVHANLNALTLDVLVTKSGGVEGSCLPSATAVSIFASQPLLEPDAELTTTTETSRKYYLQYGDVVRLNWTPGGTGAGVCESSAFQATLICRIR